MLGVWSIHVPFYYKLKFSYTCTIVCVFHTYVFESTQKVKFVVPFNRHAMKMSCKMHLRRYPLDTQECFITISTCECLSNYAIPVYSLLFISHYESVDLRFWYLNICKTTVSRRASHETKAEKQKLQSNRYPKNNRNTFIYIGRVDVAYDKIPICPQKLLENVFNCFWYSLRWRITY